MTQENRLERIIHQKIASLNRFLAPASQRLVLSDTKQSEDGTQYRDLTWERDIDKYSVSEEHIFGGNDFELFAVLSGIEVGVRMQQFARNLSIAGNSSQQI